MIALVVRDGSDATATPRVITDGEVSALYYNADAGTTGYPIIDAGMRQLAHAGWMHERLRMICARFLVKDLLVDLRRGERFFRVFNPTSQAEKFDPDGDYVRR